MLGILSYLPRRLLLESPAFALVRERREVERLPLALVLRRDLGRVAAGIGTTAAVAAFNGVLFAYMLAYLVRVASAAAVLAAGALCDVVPARTVFRPGVVALLLACWPFFRAVAVPGTASLAGLLAGFGALGASRATPSRSCWPGCSQPACGSAAWRWPTTPASPCSATSALSRRQP